MIKKKLRRTWRQLTADKKKFGLMLTVLAVGLLLWGRLILLEKVPRIATADPANQEEAGADPRPNKTDLLPPLAVVKTVLRDDLASNLFAFRHDRYRLLPDENLGETGIDSPDSADDEVQRRRELAEQARGLRLQSVIQGAKPLIIINGRVLRVGDSIEGFEIVSFDDRSAKVTRDGLTFNLTMLAD